MIHSRKENADQQKAETTAIHARIKEIQSDLLKAERIRRGLHNTIQELKGNIRVFCRVRPPSGALSRFIYLYIVKSSLFAHRLDSPLSFLLPFHI